MKKIFITTLGCLCFVFVQAQSESECNPKAKPLTLVHQNSNPSDFRALPLAQRVELYLLEYKKRYGSVPNLLKHPEALTNGTAKSVDELFPTITQEDKNKENN